MPVGTVWNNGIPEGNPDNNPRDTRWLLTSKPYREFKADERRILHPGDRIPLTQPENGVPLGLRCVAARQQFADGPAGSPENAACAAATEKPEDTSDNANSIALVLEQGPFRFFDGGDMTWNTEAALVCPVNRVGSVDVFQVNHHGLDQSNNPVLVHSLAPTVTVMNNGARKGTAPETVATLQSVPSARGHYQVHKNVRGDGANAAPDAHTANLEERCEGHYIKLSVSPSGDSYTLTIPSNGHEATYATRKHR
jgi:hypothetical protein